MGKNNQVRLTDKNLDRLAEFLNRELEHPDLAAQIPNGAHIFQGSYNDMALTRANLQLVSKILLGMTLGYVEDAPLVMVFEYKPGRQTVIVVSAPYSLRGIYHNQMLVRSPRTTCSSTGPAPQHVINLSDEVRKGKVRTFVERFREQSRHEMVVEINELVSA